MKTRLSLGLGLMLCGVASTASAQSILFDFDNGPQYSGTPLDQISGGVRAHFDATGSAYSIQNIAQVIGMYPTGFAGLGLSPGSVFQSDLTISFFDSATSAPQYLRSISLMVAPQELACDTSSTMKITAFDGVNQVGSATAQALGDVFTWPTIDLAFSSAQPFDNVVVHFQSAPPTGGDYGVIFVADNLSLTPVPEPASIAALAIGVAALARKRRRR